LALAAAALLAAAPAFAQMIDEPGTLDTPLTANVYGFFEVAIGLSYPPLYSLTTRPTTNGYYYRSYDKAWSFPGVAAQVSLTPVWGADGVCFEFEYDLQSYKWKQQAHDENGYYSGNSTLALNYLGFTANYVHYFLPGVDRVYLLAGGGYVWSKAALSSDTGGDGEAMNASFTNWRANAGFGYLHQLKFEEVGVELRADFPLLTNQFHLQDSKGNFDMDLHQTMVIRLLATFGLGRLKNTNGQ
jgi:hypothetical protein